MNEIHLTQLFPYLEIKEDIRQECENYGAVVSCSIPRPRSHEDVPGLGKVCLHL